MRRLKLVRRAVVLALGLTLATGLASAQDSDTLSISGTFRGSGGIATIGGIEYPGMLGADLAEVYANGHAHSWTLTLHGVTYSHDYYYAEWNEGLSSGYHEKYITRVHATSFDIQFFGPDAGVLNEVVSAQLTAGSLPDGAFLELWNGDYFDSYFWWDNGPYSSWDLGLTPLAAGVSFYVGGDSDWSLFSTDASGYPLVEPRRVGASYSTITDLRPGNSGGLASFDDLVDIGSSQPPVLPPPPPTLSIADASVREGDKGTTSLSLSVSRSGSSDVQVTVQYRTVDGSASSQSDYTSTSGTLTFQPGQTSRTIAVLIKGDRKREPNETFTVQLSEAVGATITDGVATATIQNDD